MIVGILPARYASTRFPKKALALLGGKPVIQRVYEQCMAADVLDEVVVATDHPEIYQAVEAFGGKVVMTRDNHSSGTDRCAEALEKLPQQFDYVINIQGDEPFVHREQLEALSTLLQKRGADIATLMHQITEEEDLWNPAVVKPVVSQANRALYFSRQALPFLRDVPKAQWLQKHVFYRHLGLYGFKSSVLKEITQLKPAPLEELEKLEQLRWLEAGYQIYIEATPYPSLGIDTPEDLITAEKLLRD